MEGSAVLSCVHVCGADPRLDHNGELTCVKCGRRFQRESSMDRDPEFEFAVLKDAAEAVGLSELADSLHKFAESRVEPGPIRLPAGRSLVEEALEEIADSCGNYIPWRLQQLVNAQVEDDHEAAYLTEALRHGMLMYAALRKASADA